MDKLTQSATWLLLSFVIMGAALYASNAQAETYLYVGAWSKHIASDGLNERHDLLAVERNGWISGRFDNSYNRETYFAAKKWAWKHKNVDAGIYAGAMRGYTTCWGEDGSNADFCPMVAPYITWETGSVTPQVFLLGEAVAVSIRISL